VKSFKLGGFSEDLFRHIKLPSQTIWVPRKLESSCAGMVKKDSIPRNLHGRRDPLVLKSNVAQSWNMIFLDKLVEAFRGPKQAKVVTGTTSRVLNSLSASRKPESGWKMLSQGLDELVPFFRRYNVLGFIICKEAVVGHIDLLQKICSITVVGSLFRLSVLQNNIRKENARVFQSTTLDRGI